MKPPGLLLLAFLAVSGSKAQTPSAPLRDPVLGRMPAFSCWEITITPTNESETVSSSAKPKGQRGKGDTANSKDTKAQVATTRVSTITKTGDIVFVEVIDKQGTKSQEWHKGDFQVMTRPEWPAPLLSQAGNSTDMAYTDYSKSDFPNLRWISKKNFVGVEPKDGHNCLVFKDKLLVTPEGKEVALSAQEKPADHAPPPGSEETMVTPVTAYLDYYSHLPIRASRGVEVFSYQFKEPPKAMQVLPANLQSAIDARQGEIKAQLHPPAGP